MIELPGLPGADPLGFLAAIGLSMLSEEGEIPDLRLAWTLGAAPVAVVSGDFSSRVELAQAVEEAFQRLDQRRERGDAVIPGVQGIPLEKKGSGPDPMRMAREGVARLHRKAEEAWCDEVANPWVARWLIALCGQLTLDKQGRVLLTPFYAPAGQMAMRTSMFEFTMEAVRKVEGPRDALVAWRRTDFDGANFDERAIRDAAVATDGKPGNKGAPSPTWLATMGMRAFPLVDEGNKLGAVGWQRRRLYAGYTFRSLIWPVWEPLLDAPAVRTMLAHPALETEVVGDRVVLPDAGVLTALGVTGVFGSSRRTLTQGDGPLGPAVRLWPPT